MQAKTRPIHKRLERVCKQTILWWPSFPNIATETKQEECNKRPLMERRSIAPWVLKRERMKELKSTCGQTTNGSWQTSYRDWNLSNLNKPFQTRCRMLWHCPWLDPSDIVLEKPCSCLSSTFTRIIYFWCCRFRLAPCHYEYKFSEKRLFSSRIPSSTCTISCLQTW